MVLIDWFFVDSDDVFKNLVVVVGNVGVVRFRNVMGLVSIWEIRGD